MQPSPLPRASVSPVRPARRGTGSASGGALSRKRASKTPTLTGPPVDDGGSAMPEPSPDLPSRVDTAEDKDLIRAAQGGDEDAFAALVRRYEKRAWRVARNMVPSDEDAQDLVQEAFLRVFKSLERFDFQHEFPTWLYRIVTNLAIDHLRKRRPTVSTGSLQEDDEPELELPDHRAEGPGDRIEAEETAEEVRDCLDTLAPHFQSVLVLRELEGLPCTEIADIVDATHVTVRWRLHRGRKLFLEEWKRRERVSDPENRRQAAGAAAQRTGGPGGAPRSEQNSD